MNELTKAEEQIMRVIWKREKAFIKDIIDSLPDPKPAYNTVGTFLKILEKKGFVSRKKYGNTYEYMAVVPKSKYTGFMMKGFVARYFEGSVSQMLSYFVKNNELDLETFEEFTRQLKEDDHDELPN
ncbi:MAG: BlaI/MecI/CopY family transcriptional regulator [Cyclobacteriaceae bacterium]